MNRKVFNLIVILVFSASCTLISRYDSKSITLIEQNEVEVIALYKTFDEDPLYDNRVKEVKEGLVSWKAYEEGKKKNSNTVTQVTELIKMFDDHINNRRERGVWTHPHMENQIYWIKEAFKIIRETENLKPERIAE